MQPSSASVERLFSKASLCYNKRRGKLSEESISSAIYLQAYLNSQKDKKSDVELVHSFADAIRANREANKIDQTIILELDSDTDDDNDNDNDNDDDDD